MNRYILDSSFLSQTLFGCIKMSDHARVKKSRRQSKRTKSVHFNIPRSEYYSVPPVSPRRNHSKWSMKCVFSNVFGVVGVIIVGSLIIGSFQSG